MEPETGRQNWRAMLERQRRPRLRSPFARAVVPVLAGVAFFAFLAGVLWLAASLSTNNAQPLGNTEFTIGRVDRLADTVDDDGPLLFQGLLGTQGRFSMVVDHEGTVDTSGWKLYAPFPADRPGESCPVVQVAGTPTFTDCDGRTLQVEALQPGDFATIVVQDERTLIVRLKIATPPTS